MNLKLENPEPQTIVLLYAHINKVNVARLQYNPTRTILRIFLDYHPEFDGKPFPPIYVGVVPLDDIEQTFFGNLYFEPDVNMILYLASSSQLVRTVAKYYIKGKVEIEADE